MTQRHNRWITALFFLVGSGCSAETTSEKKPEGPASSVQIQEEAPTQKAASPATPKGPPKAVHAMKSGMPPIAGRKMPAGHPPMGAGGVRAPKGLPAGHPPMTGRGPFSPKKALPNDGAEKPLEIGPSSPSEDMLNGKKALTDETLQANFEEAFRLTFTQNRKARNYDEAERLLVPVLKAHPKHPQSLRTMGYVAVNQGFNVTKAIRYYTEAVEADDTYGQGHYALAFMFARNNKEAGAKHYKKAMALGLPDTRGIGKSFYPDLVRTPTPPPSRKGLPPGHP